MRKYFRFVLQITPILFFTAQLQAGFYWDADGDISGNSIDTGANMGGTGTWDQTLVNWHLRQNGQPDEEVAWDDSNPDNNAFFLGTAGTVTVGAPVSPLSLTFRTNGYILTNGVIIMNPIGAGLIDVGGSGVSATIYSELAGNVGLTKNGVGGLVLRGSNSFSGLVQINAGSVTVANNFALGSQLEGTIIDNTVLSGGNGYTLNLSGGVTVTGESLTLMSHATGTTRTSLVNSNNTNTWDGPVILSGDNLSQFVSAANSLLIVSGSLSGSTFNFAVRGAGNGIISGPINIGSTRFTKTDAGTWTIASSSNLFGQLALAVGTIRLGTNYALPANASIAFGQASSPSSGTLDLAGSTQQVGGLSVVRLPNSQLIASSSTNADSLLIFNGVEDSLYSGHIRDVVGTGSAKVALRVDAGNLVLNNTNTYSGGTVINAGTLLINNPSGSGAGSGDISVNAAGTLGGIGIIDANVLAAGTMAPGSNAVGVLTVKTNVTISGGTYAWELASLSDDSGGIAGTDFDQILVTAGVLNLTNAAKISVAFVGAASAPDATNTFWQSNHVWTVAQLTGTATNDGPSNFGSVVNGVYPAGVFTTEATGNSIVLKFTTTTTPAAQPVLTSLTGAGTTNLTLSFTNTADGTSYQVEYKTNLNDTQWSILTNVVAGPGTNSVTTGAVTNSQGYFRMVIP